MVQRARLFLFNSPALEHVAYEDYHVAEKGLVVLSMMPGTNSEAHKNNKQSGNLKPAILHRLITYNFSQNFVHYT
jgi:hypothetical protein